VTLDEKLDQALKDTFPASDAFYLSPDEPDAEPCSEPIDPSS
jgi:hypothetical protein